MEREWEVRALLAGTCVSWLLQVALPGYDKWFPSFCTHNGHVMPVTEVFLQLILLPICMILQYCLLRRCAGGHLSQSQQLIALFLATLFASGVGNHGPNAVTGGCWGVSAGRLPSQGVVTPRSLLMLVRLHALHSMVSGKLQPAEEKPVQNGGQ